MQRPKKCSKKSYHTAKDAYRAVKKINRLSQDVIKPKNVYLCHCGAFHLTKQKPDKTGRKLEDIQAKLLDSTSESKFIKRKDVKEKLLEDIKNKYNL